MSPDMWVNIHCQNCDAQDDALMEEFDKDVWREKGWRFNVFDEPETLDPIQESPRSAFISGLCPACNPEAEGG